MATSRGAKLSLILGMLALAVSLAFVATRVRSLQGGGLPNQQTGQSAPEFTGIARWFNSQPLRMSELRGKVVWIDFWTYSCINCIRTLPSVKEFYARYHQFGLDVVGVHSPEFGFEKVPSNVQAAIARYGIPYPVALDSDMATWRAYGNSYWPRVYLVNAQGRIAYDRAGEGGDADIQTHLRELLTSAGATNLPAPIDFARFRPNNDITPEIYAGFERGSQQGTLANPEGYRPDSVVDYKAVSEPTVRGAGTSGSFFLAGRWRDGAEYVQSVSDGALVLLPFRAQHVYVVAQDSGTPVSVRATIDGTPVKTLRVDHSDLYELVSLRSVQTHVLALQTSPGFRLFTFTFG